MGKIKNRNCQEIIKETFGWVLSEDQEIKSKHIWSLNLKLTRNTFYQFLTKKNNFLGRVRNN